MSLEPLEHVATNAIDAFKNNPACLAAICLAALFSVLTFYGLQRDADRRMATVNLMLDRCVPPHQGEKMP